MYGGSSSALPLLLATVPALSSHACPRMTMSSRLGRNGQHDGFRFICRRKGDRVRVFSRRGHDWTDRVPLIADAMSALPVRALVIDGEGVVCTKDGVSDFEMLRAAVGRNESRAAFLYAFDLLEIDGKDLRGEPWVTRRARLLATSNTSRTPH